MHTEYEALGTSRAGMWDPADLLVGRAHDALVMEYARKRHMPLFVLNIVLILYAVYGYMVPGMFHHAGLSWERVVTAMSIEMATGIFSNLPQLALTVVGSFMLVLSLLTGYGCIDLLLRATKRVAIRSPHALPQSAVIGSMCVGTVSGSGAANAITIGSATIPAMIGAGMPPATAAAIELASSLGGQFMPPVMGISAFLMAEFLGKDYFDVVARGWVPALIYYATVADFGLSAGDPLPHPARRQLVRKPGLARLREPRRLRRRRRRPGRPDGGHSSRADVRRALRLCRRRHGAFCHQPDPVAGAGPLVVCRLHRCRSGGSSKPIPRWSPTSRFC